MIMCVVSVWQDDDEDQSNLNNDELFQDKGS